MGEIRLNLNCTVKGKLTPRGRVVFGRHAAEMAAKYPQINRLYPLTPKLDKDGYYREQLWMVMRIFGAEMFNGSEPIFQGSVITIEFPDA